MKIELKNYSMFRKFIQISHVQDTQAITKEMLIKAYIGLEKFLFFVFLLSVSHVIAAEEIIQFA